MAAPAPAQKGRLRAAPALQPWKREGKVDILMTFELSKLFLGNRLSICHTCLLKLRGAKYQ